MTISDLHHLHIRRKLTIDIFAIISQDKKINDILNNSFIFLLDNSQIKKLNY